MTNYEDIIHLPRPVSGKYPPMPMIKRAAQFAPFAALTGYDEAVEETARVTEHFISVTEDEADAISRTIAEAMETGKQIRLRYFEPDLRKEGGEYRTAAGTIRKIENGVIRLQNGERIRTELVVGAE